MHRNKGSQLTDPASPLQPRTSCPHSSIPSIGTSLTNLWFCVGLFMGSVFVIWESEPEVSPSGSYPTKSLLVPMMLTSWASGEANPKKPGSSMDEEWQQLSQKSARVNRVTPHVVADL